MMDGWTGGLPDGSPAAFDSTEGGKPPFLRSKNLAHLAADTGSSTCLLLLPSPAKRISHPRPCPQRPLLLAALSENHGESGSGNPWRRSIAQEIAANVPLEIGFLPSPARPPARARACHPTAVLLRRILFALSGPTERWKEREGPDTRVTGLFSAATGHPIWNFISGTTPFSARSLGVLRIRSHFPISTRTRMPRRNRELWEINPDWCCPIFLACPRAIFTHPLIPGYLKDQSHRRGNKITNFYALHFHFRVVSPNLDLLPNALPRAEGCPFIVLRRQQSALRRRHWVQRYPHVLVAIEEIWSGMEYRLQIDYLWDVFIDFEHIHKLLNINPSWSWTIHQTKVHACPRALLPHIRRFSHKIVPFRKTPSIWEILVKVVILSDSCIFLHFWLFYHAVELAAAPTQPGNLATWVQKANRAKITEIDQVWISVWWASQRHQLVSSSRHVFMGVPIGVFMAIWCYAGNHILVSRVGIAELVLFQKTAVIIFLQVGTLTAHWCLQAVYLVLLAAIFAFVYVLTYTNGNLATNKTKPRTRRCR